MTAAIVLIQVPNEISRNLEIEMGRGWIVELAEERVDGKDIVFIQKGLFGTEGGLKMYVYANEHPPPHFHVIYGSEENSFSILDATPLYTNGGLNKWFKTIKKWHQKNKVALIDAWNKSRPSDCPVGPIAL